MDAEGAFEKFVAEKDKFIGGRLYGEESGIGFELILKDANLFERDGRKFFSLTLSDDDGICGDLDYSSCRYEGECVHLSIRYVGTYMVSPKND